MPEIIKDKPEIYFKSLAFQDIEEIIAFYPGDDIDKFFLKVEDYLNKGYWLAGYFTYEFGYCWESIFKFLNNLVNSPLVWLGVCKKPKPLELVSNSRNYKIEDINYNLDFKEYEQGIRKIKRYLQEGLTYQVNYTFKLNFKFSGKPQALYWALSKSQPTKYQAFINTGKEQIISLSPELFFTKQKNRIITSPMKGTMPRGYTLIQDKRYKKQLARSSKIKAENLMIVDLLRNDLGKICQKVKVKKLFNIERYNTLYQMTSLIEGEVKKEIKVKDIFYALFPSGSVTGAPKLKTMQLIRSLEKEPRGIYTGAIGYISPQRNMNFNVAIRTISLFGSRASMGIGGGIIYDSDSLEEYQEAQLKAKFLVNIA